jgi:hypothetical protein
MKWKVITNFVLKMLDQDFFLNKRGRKLEWLK